ncbi:MAG: copper homeostasis protein CutC [Lachnospiraceae bacterium]|nr:copper homeostasis protein CutC [Lachnospiraceae bacterium]MDD3614751.1 copper homeostasis protein CutC [Lachnospiraceae bacterium]
MKDFILEACVDSVESAIAAQKGGAARLELCSNLSIGGTTPGQSLFQLVREQVSLPIHVLIRPRCGDFCYSDFEYEIIKREVALYKKLGADGIVIGILQPDGSLNFSQLSELCGLAEGMSLTLHRAFDVCCDPYAALEEAVLLGFDTILTSGQKDNCLDGAALLSELVCQSSWRIDILVGSGVHAGILEQLYAKTHASSFHMSGKVLVDSLMHYRKEDVDMGTLGQSGYEIWRTDHGKIRDAAAVLEQL